MKATFILGSPRKNRNTSKISGEIAKGLQDQGFDVQLFTLAELDVKFCMGEKSCEKKGECIHTDDVVKIVKEMYSSQLVVVASPSYWGDITAQMKAFIDRTNPYCNINPLKNIHAIGTKGIAVAVRAGNSKEENDNLVHTIDHFLGHHDIPLISSFTVEGIDTVEDLANRPEVLIDAYNYAKSIRV